MATKSNKSSKSLKKTSVPTGNFKRNVIVSSIFAGVFIILANTAVWTNRYLFDSTNFTTTAVSSLTSESSRKALATEITDLALQDYPKIKSVVDDTAVNFISGLLASSRTEKVLTGLSSKLQIFLTSPKREAVVINLENSKEAISKLIQISGREDETRIDVNKIPDQIPVFNPDNFPNFYDYGVTLNWLSPLFGLGAVALLAWPYVANRQKYQELLVIQGVIIAGFGFFALLIGPTVKPMILGNVQSSNMRVVVGNLYSDFISTFNSQTFVIIAFGLGAVIVSLSISGVRRYKQKKN